jgi:DNA-binding CsgD family transcriptional regulator
MGDLSATQNCTADAVEALTAVGDLDGARRCLEQVEPLLPRLNRGVRVGALRGDGLLAAAGGDKERAVRELQRALASDGEPPTYPLERGRTLLALGEVQRQILQRRAARETLEQALGVFDAIGARAWAQKAHDELARISGRRASSDGLTEAEDRVARLAAEGRQNKEIAATLYLGVGTVERHLTSVYRKLGVRSRTELAGRFAKDGERASNV